MKNLIPLIIVVVPIILIIIILATYASTPVKDLPLWVYWILVG